MYQSLDGAHSPLSDNDGDDDQGKPAAYRRWKQQQQRSQPNPKARSLLAMHSPLLASPASGRSTPTAAPSLAPPSSVLAALLCATTDSDSSSTPPLPVKRFGCSVQQRRSVLNQPLSLSDSFTFTLTTDCDSPSPSAAIVEPVSTGAPPCFWDELCSSEQEEDQKERVEFDSAAIEGPCAPFVPQPIPTYTRAPSPALPAAAVAPVAAVVAEAAVAPLADSPQPPRIAQLSVLVPPLHELDIDAPVPLVALCEFAAQSASAAASPTERCEEMFASMRIHASAESQQQQQQQQHATFATALASQKRAALAPPSSAAASASASSLPRAGRSPMPKASSQMVTLLPPTNRDRVRDVCFPPLPSQHSAASAASVSASSAVLAVSAPVVAERPCPVAFKFSAHDVHFLGQRELLSYLPMPLLQARMFSALDAFSAAVSGACGAESEQQTSAESEQQTSAESEQQTSAAAALQQLLACLGQLHQILGVDDTTLAFPAAAAAGASVFVVPLTVAAAHRRLECLQLLGSLIPVWMHTINLMQGLCAPASISSGRASAAAAASSPSSSSSSISDPMLPLQLLVLDRLLALLADLTSFPRLCASIASILQALRRGGGSDGGATAAAEAPPRITADDTEVTGHAASLYSDVHTLLERSAAAQCVATLLPR